MLRNILLPENYCPPINLENDENTNSYIIDMGFKVHQSLSNYNKTLSNAKILSNNDDIKTMFDNLIQYEKDKHAEEINKYSETISKLKSLLSDMTLSHKDEIAELKLLFRSNKDNTIASLEDEINKIKVSYEINLENQKKASLEETTKLKSDISTLTTALGGMHEKLNKQLSEREAIFLEREKYFIAAINAEKEQSKHLALISSSLCNNKNSAPVTGIIGEEIIYKWVGELFNSAEIENQSHQTAKCDLRVRLNNKLFLLEIKNKTSIVKSDLDKFTRDISENSDEIHGGLFISLNTPSIPNKGDFSLEYINDIPCIYAHVADRQTLKVSIKTLLLLNNKTDTEILTMIVNVLYSQISGISKNASALEKNLIDSRSTLDSMKKEIRTSLQTLDDLFESNPETKFEVSVQKLDFNEHEIKLLRDTYANNKKTKIGEYAKVLGVSLKHLQDRGGAAKIKLLVR